MAQTYNSPGVYISTRDLTFNTETVGRTATAMPTETLKGPAFEIIPTRNFDDYIIKFGGSNPEKFTNTQIHKYEGAYIAKSYLSESNQLFVARILGLSGYNAGHAWVMTSLGGIDQSTASATTTTTAISFTISGNSVYVSGTTDDLIDSVSDFTGVDSTEFDTMFNTFFLQTGTAPYVGENTMYWGKIDSDALSGITSGLSGSINYNALETPTTVPNDDKDNYWFNYKFGYNSINDNEGSDYRAYEGTSFILYVSSGSSEVSIHKYEWTAAPKLDYHNKLLLTLRSRGSFIGEELSFNVTGSSVTVTNTESVIGNPLETFTLSGVTINGNTFTHNVDLNNDSKSYVERVLGKTTKDKSTNLFVEEVYPNYIKYNFNRGNIKGVKPLVGLIEDWDHYVHQFQTPVSPFVVSELRGGVPQRLFRTISISDGANANTDIKISIRNIDLARRSFDLIVRSYSDTDANPVVLERFLNCNMNPNSDNFIGRLIGTSDGTYDLVSSYIMIELANNYPTDAVPAGFEGYEFRTANNVETPDIPFKNKYYATGEVIFDSPYAVSTKSSGDKLRKTYLGISDETILDVSMLKFKGKSKISGRSYNTGNAWGGMTKGFHMDISASTITNDDNDLMFTAGVDTFTDATVVANSNHAYNDIRTRKFTFCLAGGFDGWDEYRDSRTNTDDYKVGQTAFDNGEFSTFIDTDTNETYGTSDYYAYLKAAKLFRSPEEINVNILTTPSIDVQNNTLLINDIIEMVEDERKDCIYIPTLPDIKLLGNSDAADTSNWLFPQDIVDIFDATGIDSKYIAVFYPFIQYFDRDNNTNVYIPPTNEVIRNFALTDKIAFPWYATAGYSRGLMNAKRTRKIKITEEIRDLLYDNRINPIMQFTDISTPVIWGNRNASEEDNASNRINIIRLLLEAQKLVSAVGRRLLFDPNDERIRSDFLREVNPILARIRDERGLLDFRVSLDSEVEDFDTQALVGKIFLKPVRSTEFIDLAFVLTPNSQSFDNI